MPRYNYFRLLIGSIGSLIYLLFILAVYSWLHPASLSGQIVHSPVDGSPLLCKRVIVTVASSTPQSSIASAFNSLNAHVVSTIPQLRVYYLSLPGRCNYEGVVRAIEILRNTPGIDAAEPEQVGQMD
jgi:hypothetical protein